MRIIKFRAWNGNEFVDTEYWKICGHGEIENYQNEDEKLIIQQFTGLYDKNNKEIYEGDIVEYILGKHSLREVVVWNHQGYRLETFDKNSCIPLAQGLEYNIIGNIFENPELLK